MRRDGVCALAFAVLGCGALVEPRAVPTAPLAVTADAVAIGQVTTLAGSGIAGYRDGAVDVAQFNQPTAAAATKDGRVFVGEYSNHGLRVITGNVVSTLAGLTGQAGLVDGPGSAARFDSLRTLTLDMDGNAYGSDVSNCAIRKITPSGMVSTVYSGFQIGICPGSFVVTARGDFIMNGDTQVWRVTPPGPPSVVAGSATAGHADGNGASARFKSLSGIDMDALENLYVTDSSDHTVRKITPNGDVSTLAGSGQPGNDDGVGAYARFHNPVGAAVDSRGYTYLADTYNYSIRRVSPQGIVTTIAGSGAAGPGWLDGIGRQARFGGMYSLNLDAAGDLYVPDLGNNRVRKVSVSGSGMLVVKWSASSAAPPVTGYAVTATAPGRPEATCNTQDTGCTLRGLASDVKYEVVVVATNAMGTGPASIAVSATPN